MIEKFFPKTVSNILDYDAIKAAAKKYVEEVYIQIVESFGNNMVLQYMDKEHLEIVAQRVSGDKNMNLDALLDYINSENTYKEKDFVTDLLSNFPDGVEYKEFEVTGYGFPNSDFFPFNNVNRSYYYNGEPMDARCQDPMWEYNADDNWGERNFLMSRFHRQFPQREMPPEWKRVSGRRASWGNTDTWMTTGGFGKPASIHINVDEERTVIQNNGLTAVENWLGTVSNMLPINLYIEINSTLRTQADSFSGGLRMSFPYVEEEIFCTNDTAYHVEPEPYIPPEPPVQLHPFGGDLSATEDNVIGVESEMFSNLTLINTNVYPTMGLRNGMDLSVGGTVEADQGIVLDFGLRYANGDWESRTFESGYYYYSGVISQDDSDTITGYGLEVYNLNQYNGPIGCVEYNDNYSYELVAVYTDIVNGRGDGAIAFDPTILYCTKTIRSNKNTLTINGNGTFSTPIKCWRCRIKTNS